MSPLPSTDPSRQSARAWSANLGSLAAASPATRPEAPVPQLDAAVPGRLAAVLAHWRQRHRRREHASAKLRAEEFMRGQ